MPTIIPNAQSLKPKVRSSTIDSPFSLGRGSANAQRSAGRERLRQRWKLCFNICGSSLLLIIGFSQTGLAQSIPIPSPPATCDLDLNLLKSNDIGKDRNIITADTVSAAGTTTPSLWWTTEQLPPKLVTNWIANNSQKQIYLLVNTQYWNILDYVDRYRTIDLFGHAARDYGYNLKICNSQKIALAEYTCDATTEAQAQPVPNQNNNCQIWLNTTGQTGLGVQSK
jgi:hypothetical protein